MTDLSKWKKIRQSTQKIGWREVTEKVFLDPDGNEQTYVTWNKPGDRGVAILALTKENKVVVAEQYRQGPERIMSDLPGGKVDEGEAPEVAVLRELIEETGYITDEPLEYIGYGGLTAYTNMKRHYFMARNCYQELTPETIADEYVVIKLIDIDELMHNATHGRMTDADAVLIAYEKLKEIQEQ